MVHQAFLFCKPWLSAMDFYALIELLDGIAKHAIQKETDENGKEAQLCGPALALHVQTQALVAEIEAMVFEVDVQLGWWDTTVWNPIYRTAPLGRFSSPQPRTT